MPSVTRLPIVNAARCSACGGECCKRMPSSAMPADFPDLALLEDAIRSGRWTFDCWDGDTEVDGELDRVLYPRPAIGTKMGNPLDDASWGGTCTFHSSIGCELEYHARPTECRELVPGEVGAGCHSKMSKYTTAMAWRPQAAKLEAILTRVEAARRKEFEEMLAIVDARAAARAGDA